MLTTRTHCDGPVEAWLFRLLTSIQYSLRDLVRAGYVATYDEDFNLMQFLGSYPSQVGILGLQFIWTREAVYALEDTRHDPKSMSNTNKHFQQMLLQLIHHTTENLTPTERTKYETFITIHLHQKDIFEDLCKQGIRSPQDFEWTKQTRADFREDLDKCVISITDVNFEYQNEFLGCAERLVITPLTDRCYITLAQALSLGFGGCPTGPAGTGKTETIKDMGRCLGQYVVVFNCSDQMDFRGLGRIFKGLAQSGVWGCFDEFNRLELPVLSVAAQQIAIVLQAKREEKASFLFSDGDTVSLNPEVGIFTTMNPGYAGRQQPPENLKTSFRLVAMMVPDRQIIIRVKLAACGFVNNTSLARKFHCLNQLCEEQLTKQVHYDFGLRNILSVLRTLGATRRLNKDKEPEDQTMMRVLRDMNLSKLVDQDEPLFLSLLNDLFPGEAVDKEEGMSEPLHSVIEGQTIKAGLTPHLPWLIKVRNLYDMQRVRHGVMVLGPSGTGKSKSIQILLRSLTEIGQPHRELRMNPKAVTTTEMFGRHDVASNDWTDGIFTTLWRRTLRMKPNEYCWIVLDGPVDAIWIENLNSVLDDNKTLTLANGDRIPMVPNCKVVFEVDCVDNASPATISRNGMVYLSSASLPWQPIFQAWFQSQTKLAGRDIRSVLDNLFPKVMKFVDQELQVRMPYLEVFYIRQFCDLFQGVVDEYLGKDQLITVIVFCLIWSVGCLLDVDERQKFDHYLRRLCLPIHLPPLPSGEQNLTIFDYRLDRNGRWVPWSCYVEAASQITFQETAHNFRNIIIPNEYNVATQFLLNAISKQRKAVLLVGESGTGKTVMIRKFLSNLRPEEHLSKVYSFSSATTPAIFQRSLESFIERRVGSTYGPPGGKRLTIFIDDINMPIINEWGDQVANELVRQLMEMGGVYSLDKAGEFLTIMDVQFVAAMVTPGGGRSDIPLRLKRHFCVFNTTMPSNAAIDHIFQTICSSFYNIENGFSESVVKVVSRLVGLTRFIWDRTKSKLLPTPTRFHYVFNLRDLSRIWEAMTSVTPKIFSSKEAVILLWQHEMRRVLSDRLTSREDKVWFNSTLYWTAEEEFNKELAEYVRSDVFLVNFMRDLPEKANSEVDEESPDIKAEKIYEPVNDIEVVRQRIMHLQTKLNENVRGKKTELVFFNDAVCHLVRISRAIRSPFGHILLVGVGGSGKRSLARLSALIAGYKIFHCLKSSESQAHGFVEELKEVHRAAGVSGFGSVLIFTEDKVRDETCFEYINQILTTGYVPNLFPRDEMDELLTELSDIADGSKTNTVLDNEEIHELYVSRVQTNLHVVLTFSPVGDSFRKRAMNYPGLLAGCVINWLDEWPHEALLSVARRFLDGFPPLNETYVTTVANIHSTVTTACEDYLTHYRRRITITPQTFLNYLNEIKKIYESLSTQLHVNAARMESGVIKLNEAQQAIDELRLVLARKEAELTEANEKAEHVLSLVTEQAQQAEQVHNRVQQVKERCENIVLCINADRLSAQGQLEEAKPSLAEAEEALNTLRPHDITTLRKLQKPPYLVMRTMDVVLIMFYARLEPVRPDHERATFQSSWNEALRMTHNPNFLSLLLNFPRHRLNEEHIDLIEPYLNSSEYSISTAKKVCGNVAGLLSWTLCMIKYYWVCKTVIPLQDNLTALEQKLVKAKAALVSAEALFKEKTLVLAKVQLEYDNAMSRKMRLEEEAKVCYNRLCVAHQLLEALSTELGRWTEESMQLKTQLNELGGDSLQLAAFLTYCGSFNQQFRNRLMNSWQLEVIRQNLPHRHKLDLINLFTDRATIIEWALQGLPMDDLSIQNAILTTTATRYPLMIDPHEQGKRWLKEFYSKSLTVTTFNDRSFPYILEDALNYGQPILIEDITEDLDPLITDVVEGNIVQTGKLRTVKLGNKETTVLPGFKLFLSTHLANPNFTSELCTRLTLIDFSITPKGLEDQLLARVISVEREKVELSRLELIANVAANKRQINQLEENLLHRLASCEGSLVEDMNLIEVLQHTKDTAHTVAKQLAQAAEAEAEIDQAREEYRPVAVRGSLLFFLLADLATVNTMYQNGLPQFVKLFDQSLTDSEQTPIPQRRISKIIQYMTTSIWMFAVRSLFKKDRLMFTLMLAIRISYQTGMIRREELDIFIKAGSAYTLNDCPPKPARWIPDTAWINLKALSKLQLFSGIMSHVTQYERQWKHWYERDAPEESTVPGTYEAELRPFTRLLLVRCWCPDRVLSQAKRFIAYALGSSFAEDVLLQPEKLYQEAESYTPIVNLLSTGADPAPLIEQVARRKHVPLRIVSMGQGQEVHAKQAIHAANADGSWVLLQNCHLSVDYMNELYAMLMESAPRTVAPCRIYSRLTSNVSSETSEHVSSSMTGTATFTGPLNNTQQINATASTKNAFRLWITTEQHEKFPVNFLQISIKFTNEPPEGIKASLLRTYADVTQDFLDACISNEWKAMLYTLAFLHCTVQERRKYGPLGWAVPYEFTQSDFNATVQFIQNHIDHVEFTKRNVKNSGIDWKCLRYMIAEIQYGGRITDDFDMRLMRTFTRTFFQEHMFSVDFELATNYRVPRLATVAQYEEHIQSLPSRDSPEAFHLHANADIDFSTRAGSYIIECIQAMEPKDGMFSTVIEVYAEERDSSLGEAESRESVVAQVCKEMLTKLPGQIAPYKLRDRLDAIGVLQPMTIFLRQEMDRMNAVLRLVSTTINDLLLAIEGTVVMSQPLREAMDAIFEGKVPPSWLKISWESSTLGFWFTELLDRCTQLFSWLLESRPLSFWMTGFFNPQGFLTALRQEITRQKPGWALECVVLINRVTHLSVDEIKEPPVDGVYIHGLYLQGAAWDHRNARLVEPRPKQLFDMLPVVNLMAQFEVGPGLYVGGFSTLETQPGKFVFWPIKPKRQNKRSVAPIRNTELPIRTRQRTNESEAALHSSHPGDSKTNAIRRKATPDTNPGDYSSVMKQQIMMENSLSRVYIAPVYKKPQRTTTNYITSLRIACSKNADHWTLRSVAVLGDFR